MGRRPSRRFAAPVLLALFATLTAQRSLAQELGHKFPGALGIDAGVQPPEGVYVANRFFAYSAERARDRQGNLLPIEGLNLDALADSLGAQGTWRIGDGPSLSAAFALPVARISLNSTDPRTSIDRFGLGDAFVMPLKLGIDRPRFDVVSSYGLYLPTGHFEASGGSGVGRGFFTHQFSLGGALQLGAEGNFRASALASYDHNLKKRGIDLTRGDTVQVQGGAGAKVGRILGAGVAAYALWQVEDDAGTALPPALVGARDRVFGLGPEVSVLVPRIRTKLTARYEWDVYARSRPQGRVLLVSLDVIAWKPRVAAAPEP